MNGNIVNRFLQDPINTRGHPKLPQGQSNIS